MHDRISFVERGSRLVHMALAVQTDRFEEQDTRAVDARWIFVRRLIEVRETDAQTAQAKQGSGSGEATRAGPAEFARVRAGVSPSHSTIQLDPHGCLSTVR